MNIKKIIAHLGVTVAFFIISCDNSNSHITLADPPPDLKYESVALIDGPLSDYIQVLPGKYLFELKKNEDKFLLGYEGIMKVKFRFLKPLDAKVGMGYNYYGPSLKGKALDEQGAPLNFQLNANTDEDLATYLRRGSGEEWLVLRLSAQGKADSKEEADRMLAGFEKGKKIRFNSEIILEENRKESSSSRANTETTLDKTTSSASSEDCDEFLRGYEEFMNEYIAIMKKYKDDPTDISLINEYTEMLSKAGDWSDKTKGCEDDPAFATRFIEIQMKIAKASTEL